ncbi:MAG: hypothetical protein KAW09_11965 [Thermoplasmata archaeon]|nr:hypothetical protein [Thermoplasmata archaeon]
MMENREIVVGKKAIRPSWWNQGSVLLREYVREMYSPQTLLLMEERGGEVYVDGHLVSDLNNRMKPSSDVVVYSHRQ